MPTLETVMAWYQTHNTKHVNGEKEEAAEAEASNSGGSNDTATTVRKPKERQSNGVRWDRRSKRAQNTQKTCKIAYAKIIRSKRKK